MHKRDHILMYHLLQLVKKFLLVSVVVLFQNVRTFKKKRLQTYNNQGSTIKIGIIDR
jgi:hypothetical protein